MILDGFSIIFSIFGGFGMVLRAQTELDGPLQHNTARESLLGTIEVEITTQKSSLGALSQINLFISTILTSV